MQPMAMSEACPASYDNEENLYWRDVIRFMKSTCLNGQNLSVAVHDPSGIYTHETFIFDDNEGDLHLVVTELGFFNDVCEPDPSCQGEFGYKGQTTADFDPCEELFTKPLHVEIEQTEFDQALVRELCLARGSGTIPVELYVAEHTKRAEAHWAERWTRIRGMSERQLTGDECVVIELPEEVC